MATLSVTVPDSIVARVLTGVCGYNGYQAKIQDPNNPGNLIDNPVTPGQFAKDCIKQYLKNCVVAYEAVKAAEDARQAAYEAAILQITIGD